MAEPIVDVKKKSASNAEKKSRKSSDAKKKVKNEKTDKKVKKDKDAKPSKIKEKKVKKDKQVTKVKKEKVENTSKKDDSPVEDKEKDVRMSEEATADTNSSQGTKGRDHTISIALPASIIANAQSFELRSYLVGQIARALTVFCVDEIVIYEDQSSLPKGEEGVSQALAFFARNLQYLETPQYLRRSLFKMHKDLKFAGLQNPLDAPHHMRMDEWSPYREGAVASVCKEGGCWVNCGLQHDIWIEDSVDKEVRITVEIDKESWDAGGVVTGKPVSPEDPRTKGGLYWGYKTRVAGSLKEALEGSDTFGERYDLTIGTSERGQVVDHSFELPKFKHLLIVFGGLGGLEEVLEDDICQMPVRDPAKLFKTYVNACVAQGSRTIRSEEALLITMSLLRPVLMRN